MNGKSKAQWLFAAVGILVSLALFAALAWSLDGGRSPTPGNWTVLLLIPFVILNPICFAIMLAGTFWSVEQWVVWVLASSSSLWWWWHIGGVAARKLRRGQA
jgi:hypothetical protein